MARNNQRLGRSFNLHLDPQNYTEFDGLLIDETSQKIYGVRQGNKYSLIGDVRLEYQRERANKGKKVLHSSISPDGSAWIDTNQQLLSYDHLIAIDTNTHQLGTSSVSITAAYHVVPETLEREKASCRAMALALIEMWNVTCKPENLGWWQIVQAIAKHAAYFEGKIGLIVDSDLGNHEAFNARSKPYLLDYFYLPENYSLIYASDKGGPEHLSSRMIRYCHNLARDLYREENLVLNCSNLMPGIEGMYSHIRQWDLDDRTLRQFC